MFNKLLFSSAELIDKLIVGLIGYYGSWPFCHQGRAQDLSGGYSKFQMLIKKYLTTQSTHMHSDVAGN